MIKSPISIVEECKAIPGFITAAITDINSGKSYDSFSVSKNFAPGLTAAYNLEIVKVKMKANKMLNPSQNIGKIITTLSNETHIISVSPNNKYFLYLVLLNEKIDMSQVHLVLDKVSTLNDVDVSLLVEDKVRFHENQSKEINTIVKDFFFSEF